MAAGRKKDRLTQQQLETAVARALDLPATGEPSWLFEVVDPASDLEQAASGMATEIGVRLVDVEGSRATTWRDALDVIARGLEFPAYYGHNADAFIECLGDLLDPRPDGLTTAFGDRAAGVGRGMVVLITDALWTLRHRHDRDRFVDIVDAALGRDRHPRPAAAFVVIIDRSAGSP